MINSIRASQGFTDKAILRDETVRVEQGVNSNLNGFMFFKGYKSSKYPRVVVDTEYFFLYGTDHSSPTAAGRVAWGKGNDPGLSDFIEQGVIINEFQSETPFLVQVEPSECVDDELLHLFYHTFDGDPNNGVGIQQTHLLTASGGVLHEINWTKRIAPLGRLSDEDHTGYLQVYKKGISDYVGVHLVKSGVPPKIRFSYSTDCRSWTRGSDFNLLLDAPIGLQWKPQHGLFFDKYGQKWYLGTAEPEGGSPDIYSLDKTLVLCKVNSDFQIIEHCETLLDGGLRRLYEATVEGDRLHVYIQMPINGVNYGYINTEDLINYL